MSPKTIATPKSFSLLLALGLAAGCANDTSSNGGGEGGTAGSSSGGSLSAGGSSPTGGSTPTGGTRTTGGTSGAGASSGGSSTTGGTTSAGGTGGTGGTGTAACTNVRPTGTEWDEATCEQWASATQECDAAWMIDGNYCNESCGRCTPAGSGGSTGSGGATGSGGTVGNGGTTGSGGSAGSGNSGGSTTIPPGECTQGEVMVCNNQSQTHCGYVYEYWKDQGSGCMVNTADGFNIEWSNINNLLARKGLRPGTRDLKVSFDAEYQPNGNSYLTVYGWTRNPLVEYYIVDSWGNWRPPGGASVATIESDGGTYNIYRTQRVNQPSIDGNRTFDQYWSVRTEKRSSGTITFGNHVAAWEANGMPFGNLYEVSMTVEGYQSSGTANVRMQIE